MDLDKIEARANAATEGPWDAAKIAACLHTARTDVPALVARVRELEEENEKLRDHIASRIVEEEQAAQQGISKEPLNSWLAGLLFGLQRARDIAKEDTTT